MKPVVGITPSLDGEKRLDRPSFYLYRGYADAVSAVGLIPLVLPILSSNGDGGVLDDTLGALDGLVLSGGADMDPAVYGEPPRVPGQGGDRERIAFEIALVRRATALGVPVLGVCLGMQTINIAFGGTLHQYIPDAFSRSRFTHEGGGDGYYHPIVVDEGSRLHAILGRREALVNSYHHQAVKAVGHGLAVTARCADGVPEALEWAGPRPGFLLAVQWHPERDLGGHHPSRAVFDAFGAACVRRQTERVGVEAEVRGGR